MSMRWTMENRHGAAGRCIPRERGDCAITARKGAKINATGVKKIGTALHAAAYNGHEAIVRLLLEKGANINAAGGEKTYTALQAAASNGNIGTVLLLLEKGANVNAAGAKFIGNALQTAAYHRKEEIVLLLLEKGVNVNAAGERFGYGTALQAATYVAIKGLCGSCWRRGPTSTRREGSTTPH